MDPNIPQQKKGGRSDTVSRIFLESEQETILHFDKVKKRFLDVNSWKMYAGEEKASFSLRNKSGELLLRHPKVGDFFRIKIPGLVNMSGDGFDWVVVEEFQNRQSSHYEEVFIRVRPTSDPTNPNQETAHFFDEKATSSFFIKREKNEITAEVHGRNEEPNTEDMNALEKVRNFLVAMGGMIAGSKFQWKSLTEGLIRKDEK